MVWPKHFKPDSYLTGMAQDQYEIAKLAEVLVDVGARSFLEIGSRAGGSLWYLANVLPRGSRIVSIDSAVGMGGNHPGQLESLTRCIKELSKLGYDAHLLRGKSSDAQILATARSLAPFDAVFIDGDHGWDGVNFDWRTYHVMATHIVALHDVAWEWNATMKISPDYIAVPKLWREIVAANSNTNVFIGNPVQNKGIGVVYLNGNR
jgi:predicted O-methyltransferase YrrM